VVGRFCDSILLRKMTDMDGLQLNGGTFQATISVKVKSIWPLNALSQQGLLRGAGMFQP